MAVFPFSKQGVIRAIIVSPFLNLLPPEKASYSTSGISLQKGCSLSIATFVVISPFFILSLGLNSAISLNATVFHSDINPLLTPTNHN